MEPFSIIRGDIQLIRQRMENKQKIKNKSKCKNICSKESTNNIIMNKTDVLTVRTKRTCTTKMLNWEKNFFCVKQ